MKRFNILCLLVFLVMFQLSVNGQANRFLQIDINSGISQPMQDFNSEHMFAGRGMNFGGGFDYFFSKVGFGFSAGYFTNKSASLFESYLEHKYIENVTLKNTPQWNTKYVLVGPTLKLNTGKFEFDLFLKGGGSQISVPDLLYTKYYFNQSYEVYHFSGAAPDWQFAWSGGTRLIYKFNHWLGLQAKADYFTTQYVSDVSYENTFRNATDGNRNGIIEDTEFFESQKESYVGTTALSVLNLNMGFIFQLGKAKTQSNVKMIPEMVVPTQIVSSDDIETKPTPVEEVIVEAPIENTTKEIIEEPTPIATKVEEIPLANAYEEELVEKDEDTEKQALIEIPATTYDAPEARYDEEAAEFLYKAGESYFASNDFENALPCFNKLKADPKYPRAKYMFALSLCSMGNCQEAKKEYKEFAKTYKETDSRTLEIIFASHFERCAIEGKLKRQVIKAQAMENEDAIQNKTTSSQNEVIVSKPKINKEYKIQFIAIKKPDAKFPGLTKVGNIETEYFPNKSVYRYTLSDYTDLKEAVADVYKVRKMGFRDAFVAVYENGIRTNTLYHAK